MGAQFGRHFVGQRVVDCAVCGDVVVQVVVLEAGGAGELAAGLHDVDVGGVEGAHEDVAQVAVFGFEVAHAAAHVPDDVVFLPVSAERFA